MSDATDKLSTILMLGGIAKDIFDKRQAEFDKSNPTLNAAESQAADLVQHMTQRQFNRRMDEQIKAGVEYKDMDILELRLWAPDFKCAMVQLHDYLMQEYGVLFNIGLSSGIVPLAKDKLFFIAIVVGRLRL